MSSKKILGITVVTITLIGLLPLLAQPSGQRGFGLSEARHRDGPTALLQLRRLGRHLDLTEEQRSAFREILAAERAEIEPVVSQLRENRRNVRQLTRAGGFAANEAEVTELLQQQGDLLTTLALQRERVKATFYSLLSEEQQLRLEEVGPRRTRGRSGGPPA